MKFKKIILAIILIILAAAVLILKGNEDAWVCENGKWTKHGMPSAPMPNEACGNSVVCPADAKICLDGSSVFRIAPDCGFASCPKENLIQVETPRANDIIASPLIVRGRARGFWFFEADFPVKLYNSEGKLLAVAIARAQGDWMTEDFVNFLAELKFDGSNISAEKGVLVLEKDNPSGLPENADELKIPVLFSPKTRKINLYYYNSELDKDESGNILCSRKGLAVAEREVVVSQTPIQDAIKILISGEITKEEKSRGIATEFPLKSFSLKGVSLKEGVLTLEFLDSENKTSGGSCRSAILWFQIEATAKQFSEVKEVRFLPEDIFQP